MQKLSGTNKKIACFSVDQARSVASLRQNFSLRREVQREFDAEDDVRVFILFLWLVGAASAQQLFMAQNGSYPREAESILIASCRAVGERFLIPLPSPRVELRLGEKSNGVESKENFSVIHLQHWNKTLFKRAALHVCLRAAEFDLVPALEPKIPDY